MIIEAPLWLTILLVLIVGTAAVWDIRSFTIPDIFPLATLGLFFVSIPFGAFDLATFGWHLVSGLLAFGIGYLLFVFRLMGGGDVKLFAAISFWMPLSGFMVFATLVSLAGALLAGGVLLVRLILRLLRSDEAQSKVPLLRTRLPYGVAIFAGTFGVALIGRL